MCGGRRNGDYTDLCSKYEAVLDEWIILESMTERRGWGGYDSSGLAFSSVADGSQMIYDRKFCDSVADLLVNFGQFW